MNVGQLRKVLKTAEDQYRNDKRGDIADALASFATNLLQVGDRKSVKAFVSTIEKARKTAAKQTSGMVKRA
jgi:hypothetical protein